MKRLNNKGYLLVEIILAFVLAMTIMYFITELTIKVKNKNEDLLVKNLTATDQAIIYNMIMKEEYAGNTYSDVKCEKEDNLFVFSYKVGGSTKKNILNEYVDYCSYNNNVLNIRINQLPMDNFSVLLSTDKLSVEIAT